MVADEFEGVGGKPRYAVAALRAMDTGDSSRHLDSVDRWGDSVDPRDCSTVWVFLGGPQWDDSLDSADSLDHLDSMPEGYPLPCSCPIPRLLQTPWTT